MEETFVDASGTRLAVRDLRGQGPSIVLLHGLSSNLRIWDGVADRLTNRARVVACDQRGHGRSDDADDFAFDTLAADIDAIVRALGLESPVVVGHSWGASVALHYAASRPACRGVVAVDGGMSDMRSRLTSWEQASARLRPPDMDGPADQVLAKAKAWSRAVPWEAQEPVLRRSFPEGPDGIMRRKLTIERHMRIVRYLWEQQLDEVYARISCPVLLVPALPAGDGAPNVFAEAKTRAAERLQAAHANVSVRPLESVHDVPLLRPAELAGLIEEFMGG